MCVTYLVPVEPPFGVGHGSRFRVGVPSDLQRVQQLPPDEAHTVQVTAPGVVGRRAHHLTGGPGGEVQTHPMETIHPHHIVLMILQTNTEFVMSSI